MLKIEVNCVSLSKTNSGVDEKMYTILFYLGGLRIHEFYAKLGLLLPVNSIVLECHSEKYLTCTG